MRYKINNNYEFEIINVNQINFYYNGFYFSSNEIIAKNNNIWFVHYMSFINEEMKNIINRYLRLISFS